MNNYLCEIPGCHWHTPVKKVIEIKDGKQTNRLRFTEEFGLLVPKIESNHYLNNSEPRRLCTTCQKAYNLNKIKDNWWNRLMKKLLIK